MAAHKTVKELVVEYTSVVIVVAVAAGGAGYGLGQAHTGYWKADSEANKDALMKMTASRDQAVKLPEALQGQIGGLRRQFDDLNKQLAIAVLDRDTARGENARLSQERDGLTTERDTALKKLELSSINKNSEADRLAKENAILKQENATLRRGNTPPPPTIDKAEVVRIFYRAGSSCVSSIVRLYRMPHGTVQTLFEGLLNEGLIEATDPKDLFSGNNRPLDCARLTAAGRSYAVSNNLQ